MDSKSRSYQTATKDNDAIKSTTTDEERPERFELEYGNCADFQDGGGKSAEEFILR